MRSFSVELISKIGGRAMRLHVIRPLNSTPAIQPLSWRSGVDLSYRHAPLKTNRLDRGRQVPLRQRTITGSQAMDRSGCAFAREFKLWAGEIEAVMATFLGMG